MDDKINLLLFHLLNQLAVNRGTGPAVTIDYESDFIGLHRYGTKSVDVTLEAGTGNMIVIKPAGLQIFEPDLVDKK